MKTPFTGGCACGAIRYECSAEPLVMLRCHCRDCQRATGDAHASYVVMLMESFKMTSGTPQHHFTKSLAMGLQKRGFCAGCGSRLTAGEKAEGASPIVAIHAASLDEPDAFHSQMDVWTSDAQPWAHMDPALPKYEFYPPS
ncbi:MAG: GFA family protein [Luteolibacter sp.]|uniref:GFA family protein n=1 Tax=Luteolibacter sp. TaxID=1962973 RepID=UPI0032679A5D